jgi:hypothetical protein
MGPGLSRENNGKSEVEGDKKFSVHMMITVPKTRKNILKHFQSLITIT